MRLFLEAKRAERLSPDALAKLDKHPATFVAWCAERGVRHLASVDAPLLRQYLIVRQELTFRGRARSVETVRTELRHVRVFTRWCEREELARGWTCPFRRVRLPRADRPRPTVVSEEELVRLLHSARNGRHPRRDEAILLILVDTGLRASELCGLDLADWEPAKAWRGRTLGAGRLRVWGKGRKERIVSLTVTTEAALRTYVDDERAPGPGPLFRTASGGPFERRKLQKLLRRIGARAGVDVHPHKLRRTFGTNYAVRHAGDVFGLQALMGWESLAPAQHYVRLAAEDRAVEATRDSMAARARHVERLGGDGLALPRPPDRTGQPWSAEEDATIRARPDASSGELAALLGRSADSVRQRRALLRRGAGHGKAGRPRKARAADA